MTLATITMDDPNKPAEMIAWLEQNPEADIHQIVMCKNIFYVFYK